MIELKTFTIQDIRALQPCYDPGKYLPTGWSGNALNLAEDTCIPMKDVFWVIMRPGLVPEGIQRRFAAWCAAEALFVAKVEDRRSWDGVKAAISFSLGNRSNAARDAAGDAAQAAAWAVAGDAARAAARAAAWAAAGDEARNAAGAAAWAAAGNAALAAAGDAVLAAFPAGNAAEAAAWAAAWAVACEAAEAAAWAAQRKKLISMLKEESDFTLSDLLNNYPINMGE